VQVIARITTHQIEVQNDRRAVAKVTEDAKYVDKRGTHIVALDGLEQFQQRAHALVAQGLAAAQQRAQLVHGGIQLAQ
jgi:hypothetical protein